MDQDGHDLAGMHAAGSWPTGSTLANEVLFPVVAMGLPEIIDIAKEIQYAHLRPPERVVFVYQPFYQEVSSSN